MVKLMKLLVKIILSRYDGVKYGFREDLDTSSYDEMLMKTRGFGFGFEVKKRIFAGSYSLYEKNYEKMFLQAAKVRRVIYNNFKKAFKDVDVIITPTASSTAYCFDEKMSDIEIQNSDSYTVPASLAGLPAISIPCGLDKNNLPIGVHFVANSFMERNLFELTSFIESEIDFSSLMKTN